MRELERNASELERERDEAREAASADRISYEEVTEAYGKEHATHGQTRQLAIRLGVIRRRAGRLAGHQRSRGVASADVGADRFSPRL